MPKNIDYSNSAVKLTNPPEVKELLLAQANRLVDLAILKEKLDRCIPLELKDELERLQKEIEVEEKSLRGFIDTFGSYQDLETGMYGVKQRKVSVSYDPVLFKVHYKEFAPAVIKETVDTAKLQGLIKGTLINPEDLKKHGIATETESFAYIIGA